MDGSAHHSATAFLQRADDVLRRAEERLARAGVTEFHRSTAVEFAEAFGLPEVAVWRLTDEHAALLVRVGDSSALSDEHVARTAVSAEVGSRVCEGGQRHWLAREDIGAGAWITMSAVTPASIPTAEFEEILAALVRLHADAERRARLSRLSEQLQRQNELLNLIAELHTCENRRKLATILATDAAPLLGVDRISVVLVTGGSGRLTAATGVADPEQRANSSRAIERLANQCRSTAGDHPWFTKDSDLPEELAEQIIGCLDASGSRHVRTVRIGDGEDCGVLVLEQFENPLPTDDLVSGLVPQVATALHNLNQRESGPLGRFRTSVQTGFRKASRWLIAAGVVIVALVVIPAPLRIEATGAVHPVQRQHIYAPEDGVIVSVQAQDSAKVDPSAVLLRMTNRELNLRRERISGDLATATSQLSAATAFGQADPVTGLSAAARADELRRQIESLKRQLALVDDQLGSLEIKAPFGGLVFHGDLSRSLEGRPVRKGQFLMQLANVEQEWELLLDVPHESVRHVLHNGKAEGLPVSFVLRIAPGRSYSSELQWMSQATDLTESGELATTARVRLDESTLGTEVLGELRPGSTVVARIDCGYRSLGYVWFHDVIDAVRRRLLS